MEPLPGGVKTMSDFKMDQAVPGITGAAMSDFQAFFPQSVVLLEWNSLD